MKTEVGVYYAMGGATPRKKNLLVVAYFVLCGYDLAANRTNTTRLLEDFVQGTTPSLLVAENCGQTNGPRLYKDTLKCGPGLQISCLSWFQQHLQKT